MKDLSDLRVIVSAWRRAEYESRGGSRFARQLAIYDLSELWRVEIVGWTNGPISADDCRFPT